jgi:hypothetical protein
MIPDESPDAVAARLSDRHIAVLQICVEYPSREFAGAWIRRECVGRGVAFRQGWLQTLVREGLLVKGDESRGGKRRYYRVADGEWARRVLSCVAVAGAAPG